MSHDDATWMRHAISLAQQAAAMGEVPVGAIIVRDNQIIGQGFNRRETDAQSLAHAELIAIRQACEHLHAWRLTECRLFVTLEPCLMCAGAIYQSRIDQVIFGAYDQKAGATGSLYRIHEDTRLNHRFLVQGEVLGEECRTLLKDFFRVRRQNRPSER